MTATTRGACAFTPFRRKGVGARRRGDADRTVIRLPSRCARFRLLAPSLALALRAGWHRSRPIQSAVVAPPFVPKGEFGKGPFVPKREEQGRG